jgi:Zn-dependent protease with chaperone function
VDFLQQQDNARRASRSLLLLSLMIFPLALVLLVALANATVLALITVSPVLAFWEVNSFSELLRAYLVSGTCQLVSLATLASVGIGFIRRCLQVGNDGSRLIELVGASEISSQKVTPGERRLINVVEEMAVASLSQKPRLYVMRGEDAINAFVTGSATQQLLVVTQGTLDRLTRDELQALVGHELSHLIGGDIRLNLRLLVLMAGLSSMNRTGYHLFNNTYRTVTRRDYTRFMGEDDSLRIIALLLGTLLFIAGYPGMLLGRSIKAAIIRQREALADARAVQLTRNPASLASVLGKISRGPGSLLHHRYAEDINHMCFSDAVSISLRRLFGTHPSIETRLNAIAPDWQEQIEQQKARQQQQQQQALMANLPAGLLDALQRPGAIDLIIPALLADANTPATFASLPTEKQQALAAFAAQLEGDEGRHLAVLDLVLPMLPHFASQHARQLLTQIDKIINAKENPDLFDYLLRASVRDKLRPDSSGDVAYTKTMEAADSVQLLLSMQVHCAGHDTGQEALFARFARLYLLPGASLLPATHCNARSLQQALANIRRLAPLPKQSLMSSCAHIALADGVTNHQEITLLRLTSVVAKVAMPSLTSA